jgi:hypothetical protein
MFSLHVVVNRWCFGLTGRGPWNLERKGNLGLLAHYELKPAVIGVGEPPSYLARFQTRLAVPVPMDVPGTVELSSSPEMLKLKDDFRSVPFQFGKVQLSMWMVIVLSVSLTEYVPKKAMLPCTTALFSSGVPASRLLDANLGRSERVMMTETWPLAS